MLDRGIKKTALLASCVILNIMIAPAIAKSQEIERPPARMFGTSDLIFPGESENKKSADAVRIGKAMEYHGGTDSGELDSSVRAFLADNSKVLQLELGSTELAVSDVKKTLTGSYVEYDQLLHGLPILDSRVTVSVDPTGKVQRLYRDVVLVPGSKAESTSATPKISAEKAYDIVWQALKPSGKVLEPPSTKLAYQQNAKNITLVYVLQIATSEPFGYWEYIIDASTGAILSQRERSINESKREASSSKTVGDQPAGDRQDLTNQATARALDAGKQATTKLLTTAKGEIFEPNPVTYLSDDSLQDDSPDDRFKSAYLAVDIEDVALTGNVLSLSGPYVTISDFEPPVKAPSTTTTSWTAHRGDNAFNDVMTYYHLSNSLRYLEKIGYTGDRVLFKTSLWVDSDGVNGEDNSHYVPGSDRIAYGHGCVDDNEDTDVILHEFGHAITNHINSSWYGGDSGAVGEGFGDYWAFSHRYRAKNGATGDYAKIFVWDGISACWPGRRGDRITAQYNPAMTYGPHQPLVGFQSDELWSTPLISSFLELVKSGESPESVDKVVVEAMSGGRIPAGFTMPQLAQATVDVAGELYPGRPYAAVFKKHFVEHAILH